MNLAAIPGISPYPYTSPDYPLWITLHNTSSNTVSWTAGPVPSWVILASGSSGPIPPGASYRIGLNFNTPLALTQNYTTNLVITTDDGLPPLTIPITLYEANVAKIWYFAEGYTGPGFSEYLTIANPNPVTANATVTYYLQGSPASTVTKHYSIGQNARFTVLVNNEVGFNQQVSMTVTADQPIIAERPMYFHYTSLSNVTIPGGSDVLGATQLSQQFDFGYLDTTANHFTWLTILNQNPGPTPMNVTIQYYPQAGGSPITVHHQVSATSRGTVYVNGDVQAGTYSALVSLDQPGLVERPLYLVDQQTGYTGSADVVGVATPQTNWYFAEGYTSKTFEERYILSNPNTSPTTATVTFFLSNGTPKQVSVQLPAGGQQIIDANASNLLGSGGVNNSAQVQASLPILAERFMSFDFVGSIPGASDVLGSAAPSNVFYFAEGYTGGSFAEYLTIENPNATPANVTVTFLPATSGPQPTVRTYQVAPDSRFTLSTNTVMPGQSFSMVLASDTTIVAERPMYFNYYGATGGSDVIGYTGFIPPATPPPPPNGLSVYIGSFDGQVYALNANDGSVRWRYQTGGILNSPAVVNGVLYIGSQDGYLYALNTSDGSLLWRFKTGGGAGTSPVVANGIVYFDSGWGGFFYALNAQTGALVWQDSTGNTIITSTPAVANGVVYYGDYSGDLNALDATNGTSIWHQALSTSIDTGQLLVANGILYVADGFGLQAFDASKGTLLYTQGIASMVSGASPTIANGVLYIDDASGYVDALDPATGAILWRAPSTAQQSKPAIANGILYVGSLNTYLYALNVSDGSFLWRSQTGGKLLSYPTVANGVVFIGSMDGGIYAFNVSDGSLIWRTLTTNMITASPAVAP